MPDTPTEIEVEAMRSAALSTKRVAAAVQHSRADTGKPAALSDELAIVRTCLANERTLLTWLRVALMVLVSGLTLLKLFEGVVAMEVTGGALIPASALVAALGTRRYWRTRATIMAALGE